MITQLTKRRGLIGVDIGWHGHVDHQGGFPARGVRGRLGVDPAIASSVFVHTLTDLAGFLMVLTLAIAEEATP